MMLHVTRLALLTLVSSVSVGASPAQVTHPPLQVFLDAGGTNASRADTALATLSRNWRDGYAAMLIDMARLLPPRRVNDEVIPNPVRVRLLRFLERQTRQRFGDDVSAWREWTWTLRYDPHPEYAAFKGVVYSTIDSRMAEFFRAPNTTIRLDEIDWGGVSVNGIPALDHPRTVPAAAAGYLRDSHVIFGVVINGQARAYPKRILAWHEMALDRLGNEELTLVYCTLCGTVIPYKSVVGGVRRTFGTSGLLYRSNKLMFDHETMSLWSTLEGRPVVGRLAGQPLTLDMWPVVTTTWAEWKAQHPSTTVLSIDTGHERDYGEGAAYRDYFETDRLMFKVPKLDARLPTKAEVLGILVPAPGGGRQAVAFSAAYLATQRIHHQAVEGRSFVVLTSRQGANRVYEAGAVRFDAWIGDGLIRDTTGRQWKVTEEALVPVSGAPATLTRVAAFRAFWFGWYAQFPDTILVK
jgi:hypothetical protein